jgi:hypothetical protein
MKTIKAEINLYEYDELKDKSREKAFNEHLDFLYMVNTGEDDEDLNTLKENELKEYVEDSLRINEYLFFESGEMAHITHFTGKHEKAGTTEFYFNNKTYVLN